MDDEKKWHAVTANDTRYDGVFVYAVTSTGIFCRPSCASKTPLRENVRFFDTAQVALDAGFRPCKRCRPDIPDYHPLSEAADRIKTAIDSLFTEREALAHELARLGVSSRRMAEHFRERHGQTPSEYAGILRLREAETRLATGTETVLDIALALGFESVSSFYAFFHKHTGKAPGEYRRERARTTQPGHGTYYTYDLPLGRIAIASTGNALAAVRFAHELEAFGPRQSDSVTDETARQLEAYCAGKRRAFDLPLAPAGTAFQQTVWRALQTIPYGQTRSYKQVAESLGNPGASRAVGMANNKNPLLIVIPCHRVVGADGSLVGYAAGLALKQHLLDLEQTVSRQTP